MTKTNRAGIGVPAYRFIKEIDIMKHGFFIILLLVAAMLPISFAQDNTQVGLPEGAIARLGKGGINVIRFSPDGSHLAVGTDVGLWLYDVSNGEETALFTGQKGQVNAIAFSPDGKTIVSGGFSNPIIQLWDVQTGQKLSNIKNDSISLLEFTKAGNTLISLNTFRTYEQWDIETGNRLERLGNLDSYQTVTFSSAYNGFATGNDAGGINLWDASTGNSRIKLRGHAGVLVKDDKDIWALAFSPDGTALASGSEDKSVRLWNTENGKSIANLGKHTSRVLSVAFSHDGKRLASGDQDSFIKLWDIENRRELVTLIGHTNGISALTFSPDGSTLASGSYDGTIRFWNQDTGAVISTFATRHTEAVLALEFSNDNTLLTSAAINGTADVWSLRTRRELNSWSSGDNSTLDAVAISSDAMFMVTYSSKWTNVFNPFGFGFSGDGKIVSKGIKVRDISIDQIVQGPWEDDVHSVNGLVFSPDKKMLAVSIGWQGIVGWDISTGKEKFRFDDKSPFKKKLVYSHNGNLFAACGTHTETKIWDVNSQEEITPPSMVRVGSLAFSPDGKLLATGSGNRIVLWDISPDGISQHGEIGNSRGGDYLTFSPDGKVLLNAKIFGWDYLIQLWDVNTGWDLGTLSGHTERITSLKFSKDAKTLASGSYDGTVLLWDWEKITQKARSDIAGKNLSDNIIRPKEAIQYANKSKEAEAVMNWLQENSYEFEKTVNGLTLKREGSSTTISGRGGGSLGLGDVFITIDEKGVLTIRINGIGSAPYIFDQEGNLVFKEIDKDNKKLK